MRRWKESGSLDVLGGEGVLALSIVFSSLSIRRGNAAQMIIGLWIPLRTLVRL